MEHVRCGRAGTGSSLLPHQQSGAALAGQSILSGGSDPAQGQSKEAVTLPILQARNYEMIENLNDVPKPHWEIKEVNGLLKSLLTHKMGVFRGSLHLSRSGCSQLEDPLLQTLQGGCTFLVQHQVHNRPTVSKKASVKIEKPLL